MTEADVRFHSTLSAVSQLFLSLCSGAKHLKTIIILYLHNQKHIPPLHNAYVKLYIPTQYQWQI